MVTDLKNPALCARLITAHQKLLNLLVLKLQLKTESRLCYSRKLEAIIKSKIRNLLLAKTGVQEKQKLRNLILCHVTKQNNSSKLL